MVCALFPCILAIIDFMVKVTGGSILCNLPRSDIRQTAVKKANICRIIISIILLLVDIKAYFCKTCWIKKRRQQWKLRTEIMRSDNRIFSLRLIYKRSWSFYRFEVYANYLYRVLMFYGKSTSSFIEISGVADLLLVILFGNWFSLAIIYHM